MQTKLKKWIAGALAVAAISGGIMLVAPADNAQLARHGSGAAGPAVVAVASENVQTQPASGNSWFDASVNGTPENTQAMASPLSTVSPPVFAADSRGKLVLNADTHANIEKLLLEEDPAAMRAKLDKASKSLPPQATAELKVLVGQYQEYSKALTHTIPPGTAPETEQGHLKLLDSMHTLRVTYFGAQAAQALFGEEEATSRKLVSLMGAQTDSNLTQQQKADRAQQILDDLRQPRPKPPG